jgi:hypothetical protein
MPIQTTGVNPILRAYESTTYMRRRPPPDETDSMQRLQPRRNSPQA